MRQVARQAQNLNQIDPSKLQAASTVSFEAQRPFVEACSNPSIQYALAVCGIQSGKTLGGADGSYHAIYGPRALTLQEHMKGRTPLEFWFVSKSYQLCETQLETFKWRTPPEIWASEDDLRRWGVTKGDRYTHWLRPRFGIGDGCPIKLRLRTSRDPESLRATPVLAGVWGDETAYWPMRAIQNLMGRAIVARTKFIFTTSPRGKDYMYRNVAIPGGWPTGVGSDSQMAAFGWASSDNPYADKKHLERLRKMLGREYAKQELDGLFTDAIGYVYPMFDRLTHMVKCPSKETTFFKNIVGGIDPGTRDPFAAGIWGRDWDGVWYQLWEFHETGGTATRFAPIFKQKQEEYGVTKWFVDKRQLSEITDLRDAGVRAFPNLDMHAEPDRRTIVPMVSVCRELLRQGKLFIGEDHEWTAEEFEKYHYPDEVDEREKNTNDQPVDWMNHHLDQMRYAICSVEELAEDRRPRYRGGNDMKPRAKGEMPRDPRVPHSIIPTVAQTLAAQDKRFDLNQRPGRRR